MGVTNVASTRAPFLFLFVLPAPLGAYTEQVLSHRVPIEWEEEVPCVGQLLEKDPLQDSEEHS